MSRSDARGLTLLETLVALLLGMLLIHLALDSFRRLESARTRIAARTDALVALRVTTHVIRNELGFGAGGADWWLAGDSVALRAFRGTAVVCANDTASGRLVVSYRGARLPDPTKDSVLLLAADGGRESRALEAVGAPAGVCPGSPAGPVMSWGLSAAAPPAVVLARLFERGTYHLSGSALRYRRGAAGRQPLTPEVWSTATRWTTPEGWVGVELVPRDARAGAGWNGVLARSEAP